MAQLGAHFLRFNSINNNNNNKYLKNNVKFSHFHSNVNVKLNYHFQTKSSLFNNKIELKENLFQTVNLLQSSALHTTQHSTIFPKYHPYNQNNSLFQFQNILHKKSSLFPSKIQSHSSTSKYSFSTTINSLSTQNSTNNQNNYTNLLSLIGIFLLLLAGNILSSDELNFDSTEKPKYPSPSPSSSSSSSSSSEENNEEEDEEKDIEEIIEEVFEEQKTLQENDQKTSVFSILFDMFFEQSWVIIGAILSAVFSAGVGLSIPWAFGEFLEATKTAYSMSDFIYPAGLLMGLSALNATSSFLYHAMVSTLGEAVTLKLRDHLSRSLLQQDIEFYDRTPSGDLESRLSAEVQEIRLAVKHLITVGVHSTTSLIGGAISLYFMSPQLSAIMICIVPPMVLVGSLYSRFLRKSSKNLAAQNGKTKSTVLEMMGNIRTVRIFASEDREHKRYMKEATLASDMAKRHGKLVGVLQGLTSLAISAIAVVVLSYGGSLVIDRRMTTGVLSAFLFQSVKFQVSLGKLTILMSQLSKGAAASDRINEILQLKPSIPLYKGDIFDHPINGDIEVDNVSFSYPSRPGDQILSNVSIVIPHGKVYAVVGESGSGKSTILWLIERLYNTENGTIYIDGVDIKALNPSWLRSQIAIVNQEPSLFDGTIIDNIRYGKPAASYDEVVKAAKLANCHNFIDDLEAGYSTPVGERGVQLSTGQRQRIAIARAILCNPKILILDEATSALDTESERLVQEALDRLMEGRTVLMVAHRLSTVQKADSIVVLKKGVIIEQGSHQELLKKRGYYSTLFERQLHSSH